MSRTRCAHFPLFLQNAHSPLRPTIDRYSFTLFRPIDRRDLHPPSTLNSLEMARSNDLFNSSRPSPPTRGGTPTNHSHQNRRSAQDSVNQLDSSSSFTCGNDQSFKLFPSLCRRRRRFSPIRSDLPDSSVRRRYELTSTSCFFSP